MPFELVEISARPNGITGELANWLNTNGIVFPIREREALPSTAPATFGGLPLVRAILQSTGDLLVYEREPASERNVAAGQILVASTPNGTGIRYILDFSKYTYAPGTTNREFVFQYLTWAREKDGVLYVAHGHRTYARDSQGQNAYITAIDIKSRKLLWRSEPLVANAHGFEFVGDTIVSGYGFTAEPDFLCVLNRKNGETLKKIKLKTGPEYIIAKGNRLFVRTYDMDYVFEVKENK